MEAYCSASRLENPDLVHTVTEEDRKKLTHQHWIQQNLPSRHESAINVLRGRQEKEMELKRESQGIELTTLDAEFEDHHQAEEERYRNDKSRLDELVMARRKIAMYRWELKFEIWRRNFELEHAMSLIGRLPHAEWPHSKDDNTDMDPESALAVYLKRSADD
jgi:hypothetical protein